MKYLLFIIVLISFASCGKICPKMYTTFDKGYNRLGSFYSYQDIPMNTDTVIEGRKVKIIQVN